MTDTNETPKETKKPIPIWIGGVDTNRTAFDNMMRTKVPKIIPWTEPAAEPKKE